MPNVAACELGLGRSELDWEEGSSGAEGEEDKETASEGHDSGAMGVGGILAEGRSFQEAVGGERKDCCEEVNIRNLVVIDDPCFWGVHLEEHCDEVAKIPSEVVEERKEEGLGDVEFAE